MMQRKYRKNSNERKPGETKIDRTKNVGRKNIRYKKHRNFYDIAFSYTIISLFLYLNFYCTRRHNKIKNIIVTTLVSDIYIFFVFGYHYVHF